MDIPNVKQFFVSRFGDDGYLVEMDLSQLEVCALAELTGDPTLIHELNAGVDIHRRNAAFWLDKSEAAVTDQERKRAKVMTFQTLYGAGPVKMAETLGIRPSEASEFISAFTDRYRFVKAHFELANAMSRSSRSAIEPVNKLRTVPLPTPTEREYSVEIEANKFSGWSLSPTKLKNYPVQGFATGDVIPLIINMILLAVNNRLISKHSQLFFCNTIHDSAKFDVHELAIVDLFTAIEKTFIDLPDTFKELFDYTLKLDYNYGVKVGRNWHEMQELTRVDVIDILTNGKGF